jgi:hypothetical protein
MAFPLLFALSLPGPILTDILFMPIIPCIIPFIDGCMRGNVGALVGTRALVGRAVGASVGAFVGVSGGLFEAASIARTVSKQIRCNCSSSAGVGF